MFKSLRDAWRIPDLRKKMLYTLLMLVVFRIGSFVPVPGVDKEAFSRLFQTGTGSLFDIMNMFSGGAFENATIFAMSITPYVNASIIMQLLTVAIPALERLAKEGEEGRKKINEFTRYGAIILGFITAAGFYVTLYTNDAIKNPGVLSFITITFAFTAGTSFLMWLGEEITNKGIGNGISFLIFAGIIARIPTMIRLAVNIFDKWYYFILLLVYVIASIVFVVIFDSAERRITVQYAKRVVGRRQYGGQSTHIPIKVAMAGVIPIIFAISIMSFPSTLAQLFNAKEGSFLSKAARLFTPDNWLYIILYFALIVGFTFFYTSITFNPIEIANNMKKNGGSIPGIRAGKPTSDYITKVLSKITFAGSLFLAIIAVLPNVISLFYSNFSRLALGGTSLLIVVGVALETFRQLEAQMLMRHYKGFLS